MATSKKPPYDILPAGPDSIVQIQVDEGRGVVWVNGGKDGRCLIRICQIPNLADMVHRQPWMIDVTSRGQVVDFAKAKGDLLEIIYGADWRFKIKGGLAAEYYHVDEYGIENENDVVKQLLNYLSSILVKGGVSRGVRKPTIR